MRAPFSLDSVLVESMVQLGDEAYWMFICELLGKGKLQWLLWTNYVLGRGFAV